MLATRIQTQASIMIKFLLTSCYSFLPPGNPAEDAWADSYSNETPRSTYLQQMLFWHRMNLAQMSRHTALACSTRRFEHEIRLGYWAATFDGQSELYAWPNYKRHQGNNLSAGGLIHDQIIPVFRASNGLGLGQTFENASVSVRDWHRDVLHVNWDDQTTRAGATVAAMKVVESDGQLCVELGQIGDAMIVWETRDGEIRHTQNEVEQFDALGQERKNFYLRGGLSAEEAKRRFTADHLVYGRHNIMNHPDHPMGFSVLNGDDKIRPWIKTVPLASLKHLALFTDGMVPSILHEDPHTYCTRLLRNLKEGGWNLAFREVRDYQFKRQMEPVEATGLHFQFL